MNTTVTISHKDTKRVILVGDQIVFIAKDGSVSHCKTANILISQIARNNTTIVASTKID